MPIEYQFAVGLFLIIAVLGLLKFNYRRLKGIDFFIIFSLIALNVLAKSGHLHLPFFGLEYEDAFVFQADSKSITDHDSKEAFFRTQVINHRVEAEITTLNAYTGHFITFSALTGCYNKLFGYSPYSSLWFNYILSIVMGFLIFIFLTSLGSSRLIGFIASLIFIGAPCINLFQTSGLTETLSSFAISLTLFSAFHFSNKSSNSNLFFFILCLLFALTIKRENLALLLLIPLLVYPINFFKRNHKYVLLALGITLIAYFVLIKPFSTEFYEAKDILAPTFSFTYFKSQIGTYLVTLFSVKHFGLTIWFTSIALAIAIYFKKFSPKLVFLLVLFLLYLTTYTSHYRSRYFIESLEISSFETFRYLNNIFVIIPFIIGYALRFRIELSKRITIASITAICILLPAFLLSNTIRKQLNKEEYLTRIVPARYSLNYLDTTSDTNKVLITDIPLVAEVFNTSSDIKIADSYYEPNIRNLKNVYLLIPEKEIENITNIEQEMKIIHKFRGSHLNYQLIKL